MSTTTHLGTTPAEAIRDLLSEHLSETDAPGKLAVITALLDDVLETDLPGLPSAVLPDLVGELEQARRRLDALTTATVSAVEADGT